METNNKNDELVPMYEYRILLCQKMDKELQEYLNSMGAYGWYYRDYIRQPCSETGSLIIERKKMILKPE